AGYQLSRNHLQVDAFTFMEKAKTGQQLLHEGKFASAIAVLEEASVLWRRPIMEDLVNVDRLRSHVLRIEEAWQQAVSARIDGYLNTGQAQTIIGELRSLLDSDPLAEHTWYQLILALHLKGLRNEAILAFHQARETF